MQYVRCSGCRSVFFFAVLFGIFGGCAGNTAICASFQFKLMGKNIFKYLIAFYRCHLYFVRIFCCSFHLSLQCLLAPHSLLSWKIFLWPVVPLLFCYAQVQVCELLVVRRVFFCQRAHKLSVSASWFRIDEHWRVIVKQRKLSFMVMGWISMGNTSFNVNKE